MNKETKKLSGAHWANLRKDVVPTAAKNSPGKRDGIQARMNGLAAMIKKFSQKSEFDRRVYNGEEQPTLPNQKNDALPEDRLAAAIEVTRDCLRAHELLVRQCEHFVEDAIACLENARKRNAERMRF